MYINVLVETKVKANDMTFTYHADSNYKENLIGKRVLVPFSNRIVEGFALEYTTQPKDYVAKDIIKVVDNETILNDELISLGKFISKKYLCSLIYAYQVMLPKALKANHKINYLQARNKGIHDSSLKYTLKYTTYE